MKTPKPKPKGGLTVSEYEARLLACAKELSNGDAALIRTALNNPERVGAVVKTPRSVSIRTSLGYAVHSSFVTPLGRRLIEALDGDAQ